MAIDLRKTHVRRPEPSLASVMAKRRYMLICMAEDLHGMDAHLHAAFSLYPAHPDEFQLLQDVWLRVRDLRTALNALKKIETLDA